MSSDIIVNNDGFNCEQNTQSADAGHKTLERSAQADPSPLMDSDHDASNASSKPSVRGQKTILVKVDLLREIDLPGLPPVMAGPRYEAIKASIFLFGLLQPLIVNERNEILSGRSRWKACKELGMKEIRAVPVSSEDGMRIAMAAEVRRQWSPLEVAGIVSWAQDCAELETQRNQEPKVKTNHFISRWMAEALGMPRGTSPRQVTGYLKLGRSYSELQSVKQKAAVEAAATLNEALKQLPSEGKTKKKRDPSKVCRRTLEKFERALEEIGQADVVGEVLTAIRAALAKFTTPNAK